MKTALVLTLCISLTILKSKSQSAEANEVTYKAYITQNIQDAKGQWKKIVADAQSILKPNEQQALYGLALAQFGLLTASMRDQDEDLFDDYADETEKNLKILISQSHSTAEPRALLAALYGLKMGYSPMKGMFLGAKSQSLMDNALKEAPTSPLVWKLYANSKFFTPETWGGDISEAIKSYEKSIRLYESDSLKIKNNWLYLDTIAFLGQAYLKNKQPAKATEMFEKALKVEPNYSWVKLVLLPKAKKNATSK
jgi:tetratricopeptide (TPR) repeat protein